MPEIRSFKCSDCEHEWEVPHGTGKSGKQMDCPKCGSSNIHRTVMGRKARQSEAAEPGRHRGGRGRGRRTA